MNINHVYRVLALSLMCALFGLAACQPDGAEKAGKKIDETTERAEKQIDGAKQDVIAKAESVKESAVDQVNSAGEYLDDAMITGKIKEKILSDDFLKASQIQVTTVNGVVKLTGVLESEQLIGRAIGLVNSQRQVKSVQNELTLKNDATSQ